MRFLVPSSPSLMSRIDANRLTAAVSAFANGDSQMVGSGESNRICRNLFGPVNHEENARFLADQLSCMKKEARLRWNFDFDNGTPISGRFQWTPVLVEPRSLPPSPSDNPGQTVNDNLKVTPDQHNDLSSHPQPPSTPSSANTRPLLRQTKITDHMPKLKRIHPDGNGGRLLSRTSSSSSSAKVNFMKRPKTMLQPMSNGLEAEWKPVGK